MEKTSRSLYCTAVVSDPTKTQFDKMISKKGCAGEAPQGPSSARHGRVSQLGDDKRGREERGS